MELLGESNGSPLFNSVDLSPGEPVSRCVTLQYSGSGANGYVEFGVVGATGDLLSQMTLQVEEGTGGGAEGSCTDFSGTVLYSGSFDAMTYSGIGGAPLVTKWDPASVPSSSFEITISVQDTRQAMGLSGTGDLQWVLAGPQNSTSLPTSSVVGAPGTTLPRSKGPTRTRHNSKLPRPEHESSTQTNQSSAPPAPSTLHAKLAAFGKQVVRQSWFLLLILFAILVFLLFQNNMDKADPKLRLAAAASEPDLEFVPPNEYAYGYTGEQP
jgi:hypothetical protein